MKSLVELARELPRSRTLRGDAILAAKQIYQTKHHFGLGEVIIKLELFNDGEPGAKIETKVWLDLPMKERGSYS